MRVLAVKHSCVVLFFCCIIMVAGFARAEKNAFLAQDEAKAVLIYNFIKHTNWKNSSKPIVEVGFLGADQAVIEEFKRIADEATVEGRAISPQVLKDYDNAGRVEVLVLGARYNRRLSEIALAISNTQTLIVSDGAKDRTSAMINFIYPSADKISFEVNKSNIIFEGLKVSNDVLIYGGTEIEVADLYNQMEEALVLVKNKLRQQEAVLFEQQKTVTKQAEQIHAHYELMDEKNKLILEQTEALAKTSLELQIVDNNLNQSQYQLSISESKIAEAKQELSNSQLKSMKLAQDIQANKVILQTQTKEIDAQNEQLKYQSTALNNQAGTIELQRNIILCALLFLFVTTSYIIVRQKKALEKERELLEQEAHLVEAQQKSIDAYEDSLKVKNDFMVAINHELKTPMHIMNSALHNIHQGGEIESNLDFLGGGSEQMASLISDMLMYSELTTENVNLYLSCVPIRQSIDKIINKYRRIAQKNQLELHCEMSETLPAYVLADGEKLLCVMEKILSNACKFTTSGIIDVSIKCETQHSTYLKAHISDTGIGIAPDQLGHIFEPFMQRETGLSRRYDGLGIGLSICKSAINLLNGDIVVESTLGQGTDVYISIPIEVPSADQIPQSSIDDAAFKVDEELSIMLVEDNDISRMVMEKLLAGLGYQCISVKNGQEALDLLPKSSVDIILMDIQMPEMDGIECTRRIRTEELSNVPIIAVTANLTESVRSDCLSVGMNAVVSKPVLAEELASTLNACLASSVSANQ